MHDDPTLTLREGLERLCQRNEAVFSARDVTPEAAAFFRCHDAAHVVFGCDTSLCGEGVLKMFTIFGTTLGFWKHIAGYAHADAGSLFMQYRWRHLAKNVINLVTNLPRAIVRARQMSKPWPWSEHAEYLDVSLADIRREFNIRVI